MDFHIPFERRRHHLFSERELMFIFAIYAVARPSVCRLSVCNARAPYSGGCNFPQFFYGVWYLDHPLMHRTFYGNRPMGTPPLGELNPNTVAKYSDFGPIEGYISETVQDKLVLITNRKSHMSFRLTPKLVTGNGARQEVS